MSCTSILRIGPFPDDNDCANQLRSAIVEYFHQTEAANNNNNDSTTERNRNDSVDVSSSLHHQISITNRYFSAKISLLGIHENQNENDVSIAEDGIILVFDAEQSHPKYATSMTSSFDTMESIHDLAIVNQKAGELLRLCISIGNNRIVHSHQQHTGMNKDTPVKATTISDKEYEEEYSRRILWCLDRGYEYIEVPDLSKESLLRGHDERDKDGFARIVEAISGTVWTSAIMAQNQKQTLKQSFEQTRKEVISTFLSDNDDVNQYIPPDPLPPMVDDENDLERERKAHAALLADCVDESRNEQQQQVQPNGNNDKKKGSETDSIEHLNEIQQERALNILESSLQEARRIRELSMSGQLTDEERKQRAADAAMIIMKAMDQMGFDDDDDDDDDDDHSSVEDQ